MGLDVIRRRTHPARRRVRTLPAEREMDVFSEAVRAVHQNLDDLPLEATSDRNRAEGYEQALRDLAREVNERRAAALRAANSHLHN